MTADNTIEPTMLSSVKYSKSCQTVRLQGTLYNSHAQLDSFLGSIVFTLPEAYRPAHTVMQSGLLVNDYGTSVLVIVQTNGDVSCSSSSAYTGELIIGLDGISFLTDY